MVLSLKFERYVERVGNGSGRGTGDGTGTGAPFRDKPCLERVGREREVQLTHPFETTGGAFLERVCWVVFCISRLFICSYLFIYLFIFCLFISFEFTYLFVYSFIHNFVCLASIKFLRLTIKRGNGGGGGGHNAQSPELHPIVTRTLSRLASELQIRNRSVGPISMIDQASYPIPQPFRFRDGVWPPDRQNYSSELQRVLIYSFCEYFNKVFEYSARLFFENLLINWRDLRKISHICI